MWKEVWHNSDASYAVECDMSNDEATCGIMHESTQEVSCEDLPGVWKRGKREACTCTLPCSHTFHPSVLALHFLTRGMTCPICRGGDSGLMSIESVPRPIRKSFEDKSSHMIQEIMEDDVSDTLTTSFARDHVDSMLTLQADICVTQIGGTSSTVMIVTTPLLRNHTLDEEDMEVDSRTMFQFGVHRSFKRALFSTLHKLENAENSHTFVNFSICHPVLSESIESGGCTLPLQSHHSLRCRELAGNEVLSELHIDSQNCEVTAEVNIQAVHRLCMHCMFTALQGGMNIAIQWVHT